MFSVTLIANPEKETLSQTALDSIALRLDAQEIRWLEKGVACALVIPSLPRDLKDASATLGMTCDWIIQPHPRPRYKLFVADMESTIIENECLDELADYVGLRDKIETITRRAMNGELDFEAALKERVSLLAGLPESALQEVYDQRVRLMPGAIELMKALKDAGIYTMLVSGGFSFYAELIKQRLGFDEQRSNRLEIAAGKLTGNVLPPILDKHAKLAALNEGCAKLGITPDEVIAIGDGANDLPMLLAAGLGVAYHAKPNVRAEAKSRLDYNNLRALAIVIKS
ncbi:MAG: phosphoserine phosphatase SerB [Rickettsiales bacterium]|jgi:phosphoserine phosphatase|nr:phosphoserine phosphatase SerB [Rickettsiales bacterium]